VLTDEGAQLHIGGSAFPSDERMAELPPNVMQSALRSLVEAAENIGKAHAAMHLLFALKHALDRSETTSDDHAAIPENLRRRLGGDLN
jgi:hypothetical protein